MPILAEAIKHERRAFERRFKPHLPLRRYVQIEVNHRHLIFVARELAHLQGAGMRRRFPVHVPRAFERLIRADAVEIVAHAAPPGFPFSRDGIGQGLEIRTRVQARVHHDLVAQRHKLAALRESEREARGELKGALAVASAFRKRELDRLLDRDAARHGRKIHGAAVAAVRRSRKLNAERRRPSF